MIALKNVSKMYGSYAAVRALSVSIERGQCVGLLGPNGAGKTTTIRMITGFIPPSEGRVEIGGHDTLRESLHARRLIGYLPESTPLHAEMRVRDLVRYRARLYGVGRRAARAAADKALDTCRVTDVAARRVGHLSKGYKQRVGLAAALVHNPPVLVLDEPTSGLDPTQIRETRSLIRALAERRTVLVSSHILPEIEQTCDRVLVMAGGRLCADGSPSALRGHAAGETYVIELHAREEESGAIGASLRAVSGVRELRIEPREPGWLRVEIAPEIGAADLREALAKAARASGEGAPGGRDIRELSRRTPTLEEAFVRIIEGESGGGE